MGMRTSCCFLTGEMPQAISEALRAWERALTHSPRVMCRAERAWCHCAGRIRVGGLRMDQRLVKSLWSLACMCQPKLGGPLATTDLLREVIKQTITNGLDVKADTEE